MRTRLARDSFISADGAVRNPLFSEFVTDFILHVTAGSYDIFTWYQLQKQLLSWFTNLHLDLDTASRIMFNHLGIDEASFRENISSPDKFQNYMRRLSPVAKQKLVSSFLADKLCDRANARIVRRELVVSEMEVHLREKRFFYEMMASTLSIKLNYVEEVKESSRIIKKLVLFVPLTTVEIKDNNVRHYLRGIYQIKKTNPSSAENNIAGVLRQKDGYRLDSKKFFEKRGTNYHSDIDIQLLLELKNILERKSMSSRGTIRRVNTIDDFLSYYQASPEKVVQMKKVIQFWFPTPALRQQLAEYILPVIDFATDQLHAMQASCYGNFMVSSGYPENIQDAMRGLQRLGEHNINKNYMDFKKQCAMLKNRVLQVNLSKMLDHLLIVACNERVKSGKDGSLFVEASNLMASILFIASHIEGNSKSKDELQAMIDGMKSSMERIRKNYVGFSAWSFRRWATNLSRPRERTVNIEALPKLNLNAEQFTSETDTLIATIEKNLRLERKCEYKLIKSTPELKSSRRSPELLTETLYTKPKSAGAKPGGQYTILGADRRQRTFMIKQGEGINAVGETLSEVLASLVYQQSMTATDNQYAAPCHLLVRPPEDRCSFMQWPSPLSTPLDQGTINALLLKMKFNAAYVWSRDKKLFYLNKELNKLVEVKITKEFPKEEVARQFFAKLKSTDQLTHADLEKITSFAINHTHKKQKEPTYVGERDFAAHVFVASQYYDSYRGMDAFEVAGMKERPKMAATRHGEMFDLLIELNNACQLGLEHAFHSAIKTCDYDFHTGNFRLIFDEKNITDPVKRAAAMRLIDDFQAIAANNGLSIEKKLIPLIEKMKAIQGYGVKAFFQKIDHGNSYYSYGDRSSKLDNSYGTFFLEKLTIEEKKLKIKTKATNHIPELVGHGRGPRILLTAVSCKILMNKTKDEEMSDLRQVMTKFFDYLHNAALEHLTQEERLILNDDRNVKNKLAEVEFYLLNAFYKHTTNKNFPRAISGLGPMKDVADVQRAIVSFIETNRLKTLRTHNTYYLDLLHRAEFQTPRKQLTDDQKALKFFLEGERPGLGLPPYKEVKEKVVVSKGWRLA